jgi:uncharacterized protein YecT (DUF1311 family)
MNQCAQAEYAQSDTRLNNVYQTVKAQVSSERADQLVAAEQAWIAYRDAYCNFVQAQFAGGSMQPMIYSGCMTQVTSDRINALQGAASAPQSYEAADADLNAVYQDLQSKLTPEQSDLLVTAQTAWIDYRDLHCAFAQEDTNTCLARITAAQAAQLKGQLESRSL